MQLLFPIQNNRVSRLGNNLDLEYTTIDDVIRLAKELLIRLSQLGDYKHPLDVRRGRKEVVNNSDPTIDGDMDLFNQLRHSMHFDDDCNDAEEKLQEGKVDKSKISNYFAYRLKQLGPNEKIRAILLINTDDAYETSDKRQGFKERQAAIEATRKAAEQALRDIEDILKCFDGQRLTQQPDIIGSIPIETTAAGIDALTTLDRVKLIIEDQDISLIL